MHLLCRAIARSLLLAVSLLVVLWVHVDKRSSRPNGFWAVEKDHKEHGYNHRHELAQQQLLQRNPNGRERTGYGRYFRKKDEMPGSQVPSGSNSQQSNTAQVQPGYNSEINSQCSKYAEYSSEPRGSPSNGTLQLPFQRPTAQCRTFISPFVESVIEAMNQRIANPDLARIFENCFPNTLDTTIRWHVDGDGTGTQGAKTFIVTGDIDAQWIRDSQRQLLPYVALASKDDRLKSLVVGTINQYVDFLAENPYCNAFNPPKDSGIPPTSNNQNDIVFPSFDPSAVFECKYELDSVASYFALANQYFDGTGDVSFVTDKWLNVTSTLLNLLRDQQLGTFDANGDALDAKYTFQRRTSTGSETLVLSGEGNPVASNTSLVRSAFRPSDDATILQLFIPANAQVASELQKSHRMLVKAGQTALADEMQALGKQIERGVWEYGTFQHREYGKVFAYEVDGYGGVISLDDANLPSLLALSDLGFCDRNNQIYRNTRKMVLSKNGNPYFLTGKYFWGIGGPHIGIKNAWPMSHFLIMRTSDSDDEIRKSLELVMNSTAGLGLMHESIHVDIPQTKDTYTRPWFAWANSEFAMTILDLAQRKPHLIFKKNTPAFKIVEYITDEKTQKSVQDISKKLFSNVGSEHPTPNQGNPAGQKQQVYAQAPQGSNQPQPPQQPYQQQPNQQQQLQPDRKPEPMPNQQQQQQQNIPKQQQETLQQNKQIIQQGKQAGSDQQMSNEQISPVAEHQGQPQVVYAGQPLRQQVMVGDIAGGPQANIAGQPQPQLQLQPEPQQEPQQPQAAVQPPAPLPPQMPPSPLLGQQHDDQHHEEIYGNYPQEYVNFAPGANPGAAPDMVANLPQPPLEDTMHLPNAGPV